VTTYQLVGILSPPARPCKQHDQANNDSEDLKSLIGNSNVEQVQNTGFESQYKKVMEAVKEAGNGTVKVFRVELEGTRAEYYVVAVDDKKGRIVGLKALAVES
jgi:hypothetical protein